MKFIIEFINTIIKILFKTSEKQLDNIQILSENNQIKNDKDIEGEKLKMFQFSKTKILPDSCLRGYLDNFDVKTYLKQIGCFLYDYKFNSYRITEFIEQYWSDSFVGKSLNDVLKELWDKPSLYGKTVGQNVEDYYKSLETFFFTVSDIINETCKSLNINQKIILVKLQKEQSLLTKKSVDEVKFYKSIRVKYPLDGACGVGYYDDGTIIPKFNGLRNQIVGCCQTLNNRFNEWKSGTSITTLEGEVIIPENAITWAAYRYTPHIKAQEALYNCFKQFFPEELMI